MSRIQRKHSNACLSQVNPIITILTLKRRRHFKFVCSLQCDQKVGIKLAQLIQKLPKQVAAAGFTLKVTFLKQTKELTNICATLVPKFVAKTFQKQPKSGPLAIKKQPNLVTLAIQKQPNLAIQKQPNLLTLVHCKNSPIWSHWFIAKIVQSCQTGYFVKINSGSVRKTRLTRLTRSSTNCSQTT